MMGSKADEDSLKISQVEDLNSLILNPKIGYSRNKTNGPQNSNKTDVTFPTSSKGGKTPKLRYHLMHIPSIVGPIISIGGLALQQLGTIQFSQELVLKKANSRTGLLLGFFPCFKWHLSSPLAMGLNGNSSRFLTPYLNYFPLAVFAIWIFRFLYNRECPYLPAEGLSFNPLASAQAPGRAGFPPMLEEFMT